MGFEPTISAGERTLTHALDRAATGTGFWVLYVKKYCVCLEYYFPWRNSPPMGHGLLIHEVPRSHSDTPQSVGLLWTSYQLVAVTSTWQQIQQSQQTDIHAPGGIRTHSLTRRAASDPHLRPRGYWYFSLRVIYLDNKYRGISLLHLLCGHRKARREVSCSPCRHHACSCCRYLLQPKGNYLSVSVNVDQPLRQWFVHLPEFHIATPSRVATHKEQAILSTATEAGVSNKVKPPMNLPRL